MGSPRRLYERCRADGDATTLATIADLQLSRYRCVAFRSTRRSPALDPGSGPVPPVFSGEEQVGRSRLGIAAILFISFVSYCQYNNCVLYNDPSGLKSRTPHSMTSSARARIDWGIVRPSALAVLRLTTSSNLVACSTGRSAGLAPLRIFPA